MFSLRVFLILLILSLSCSFQTKKENINLFEKEPLDKDTIELKKTISEIINTLEKDEDGLLFFKERKYRKKDYIILLKEALFHLNNFGLDGFKNFLDENFDEVIVSEKALITGYYLPIFEAKWKKEGDYIYPLYSKPKDLMALNLSILGPAFIGLNFIGRIDKDNRFVTPYFSREEIEKNDILKDRAEELCYLNNPLDVLLLQIQGSGLLKFEDGKKVLASYNGKNGWPYKSIGKYLTEKGYLKDDEISWDRIKAYLRENKDKFEEVYYQNQSYVFFKLNEVLDVKGSSMLTLVPYYSVAVDKRIIPFCSLLKISFDIPEVSEEGTILSFRKYENIAFAADEGSAIIGENRIDIFLGTGKEAEKIAHRLKSNGTVKILLPQKNRGNNPLFLYFEKRLRHSKILSG